MPRRDIRRSVDPAQTNETLCEGESMKTANPLNMTYEDFSAWAVGFLLLEIGRGEKIRDIVYHILDLAQRNTVFGKG